MQRMLLRKSHGAVNLMTDRSYSSRSLAAPGFGDRNGEPCVIQARRLRQGVSSGRRCSDLPRRHREHVLNGLKLGDWTSKLYALVGVIEGKFKTSLKTADDLLRPDRCEVGLQTWRNRSGEKRTRVLWCYRYTIQANILAWLAS